MANGGRNKPRTGGESQQPLIASERLEGPATATLELSLDDLLAKPLPSNLPPEMFTGPGLLALADLVPAMTAYYDRKGCIQFINKLFADWLGQVARGNRRAIRWQRSSARRTWRHRKPMLEAALKGERQFFVAELDHPTRGMLVAQTEYIPWIRPGGHVEGLVCVVTDVTEQRIAERALKESEARFRRIANSAPAMMWVTRLDRVRDFVNDHYVAFVGGPEGDREAVRTIDWRTQIHPDDVDRIVAESIAGEADAAGVHPRRTLSALGR